MLSSFRGSLIGTLCGGARFDQQTFDPNPDLSITVGRQPWQELLVDSRALCRVSPVLRKRLADTYILRGIRYSSRSSAAQHGRSRPCAMIRENFPDDDPAAFCTLMDIIHSRYEISNPVPAPDVEIMFEIVRLAYKYEMVRVLRPYSAAWLADLRIRARISVADIDPGLLKLILFVAWVLGEDKLFQVAAERLAELWLIDEEGELIENDGGMRLKDYNYLQELDILDAIKRFRQDRVMVIVSACNKMGDKLTESPSRAVTNFGSSITRTRPLTSKHPVITREHLGLLVIESVASGLTHLFIPSSDQTTSPALHMALVDMQACVHQTLSHPDLGEWHAWYASETRLGDANVKSLVSPIMERIMQMQAEQSFVKRTAVPGVRGRARTRNRASGH